jgi:serine/threonine protein kinase
MENSLSQQKQRAGKFIASGSYGCTFYPHLKCKDTSNKKRTIGKVFPIKEDADEEDNIMKAIKSKLDPTNEFTVPYYGKCKVHYVRKTDEAASCGLISNDNVKGMEQLLYAYGGQSLGKKFKTKGTINALIKLLPAFLPIFEGLDRMNTLKWVHFDIKPDNMLFFHSKLYLIDFGIVSFESDVYSNVNAVRLISDYAWYPPEFKTYLFKKGNDFERLYKRVMDNFQGSSAELASAMITVLKINPMNDLRSFFKDNVAKKEYIKYASKVDVYSLGLILLKLYLWSGFHQKIYKTTTKKVEIRQKLISIIAAMICFDPRKRANVAQAKSEFEKLVNLI